MILLKRWCCLRVKRWTIHHSPVFPFNWSSLYSELVVMGDCSRYNKKNWRANPSSTQHVNDPYLVLHNIMTTCYDQCIQRIVMYKHTILDKDWAGFAFVIYTSLTGTPTCSHVNTWNQSLLRTLRYLSININAFLVVICNSHRLENTTYLINSRLIEI